jgi:hypothetical protein
MSDSKIIFESSAIKPIENDGEIKCYSHGISLKKSKRMNNKKDPRLGAGQSLYCVVA